MISSHSTFLVSSPSADPFLLHHTTLHFTRYNPLLQSFATPSPSLNYNPISLCHHLSAHASLTFSAITFPHCFLFIPPSLILTGSLLGSAIIDPPCALFLLHRHKSSLSLFSYNTMVTNPRRLFFHPTILSPAMFFFLQHLILSVSGCSRFAILYIKLLL